MLWREKILIKTKEAAACVGGAFVAQEAESCCEVDAVDALGVSQKGLGIEARAGKKNQVKEKTLVHASKKKTGDWECFECANTNYSFRDICGRCELPRATSKVQTQLLATAAATLAPFAQALPLPPPRCRVQSHSGAHRSVRSGGGATVSTTSAASADAAAATTAHGASGGKVKVAGSGRRELKEGNRVSVWGYGAGTVRFLGKHAHKKHKRVGVELDQPVGQNNGTVNGRTYFVCKNLHGLFVEASKAARLFLPGINIQTFV
jgi:hypothetical protein